MLVGVVVAVLQLRDLVRARQTDLVLRLYSTYDSLEFLEAWHEIFFTEFKDYDDFVEKFDGKRYAASFVLMFYEEVGVLLRGKPRDIGLIHDLLGEHIRITWEKVKNVMEEAGKRYDMRVYPHFEYLYNGMKKREQQLAAIL